MRLIALVVLLFALPAHADTVALLPLDGDKKLEIYGQPVAAELGRAMKSAGIDVVVVGAKMAVPEGAALIVDGTIKAKGGTVTLSLRIRDPRDGSTLDTLPPSTSPLVAIDRAAAELSGKLVPAVQAQIAKREQVVTTPPPPVDTPKPVEPTTTQAAAPQLPELKVSVGVPKPSPALQLLSSAFPRELETWGKQHGHTVDTSGEGTVQFELLSFTVTPGKIPLAKARVRMRVFEAGKKKFDRVIRTDTIVGDRDITEQAFAERTAREVLLIAHANLRRTLADWK